MCLILFGQSAIIQTKQEWLENAYLTNPDSIGITDGKTSFYPSSVEQLNALLKTFKSNVLVHFRFATKGEVTLSNTHPFELKNGSLLAHNGTISKDELLEICKVFEVDFPHTKWDDVHNRYSDTKVLVDILDTIHPAAHERILEVVSSKFALWTPEGDMKLIGDFIKKDGLWLSNKYSIESYQSSYRSNSYPGYLMGRESYQPSWEYEDDFDTCPDCTNEIDFDWKYCANCGCDIEAHFYGNYESATGVKNYA